MSRRLALALVPAVAVTLAMSACSSSGSSTDADSASAEAGADGTTVKIGVVGAADEQWQVFADAAAKAGIDVDVVNFSDYQVPNRALADGEIDLNQFQHLQFLANSNIASGNDLQPIGATAVYPLNVYSIEYTDVAEIPDGAEVAVPNDATNLARALLTLQAAGLIELRDGGDSFSAAADVLPSSRVKVTPVDAAQTATALAQGSVAAAVVNNDFVAKGGLSEENIVFADDPSGESAQPYYNVWVSRAEDADNPTYLELVEIWHSPEVEEAATRDSGGLAIFVDAPAAKLQDILATITSNAS